MDITRSTKIFWRNNTNFPICFRPQDTQLSPGYSISVTPIAGKENEQINALEKAGRGKRDGELI